MRITQNTLYNSMRYNIQTNSSKLLAAQERMATQKKINRLSDDPVASGRVLDLKASLAQNEQYQKNIERVSSLAGIQDSAMTDAQDIVVRIKNLLLTEANELTSTSATREATRTEISTLTEQLAQIANTRYDGQYIFSGFATDTPAFSYSDVTALADAGNTGGASVTGQSVTDATAMTYHTYEIQFTAANQYDIVDTTTGLTAFAGQSYTSGQSISFAGVEIAISDSPGAPAAGDVFTVNQLEPGTYQGDSQVQEVEIQSGTTIDQNVPGNKIFSGVGLAGGIDVFSVLNDINQALRSNDRAAISSLLDDMDTARTQLSNQQSGIGAKVNLLEDASERLLDIETNLQILKSDLEDIDVTEAVLELNKQNDLYESTLASAAKVIQVSLLDFLS